MKSQLGVWQFFYEKRDIRNKEVHPATFPLALAKKTIELFTHKGELVVDPFNGSGTTLLAANDLERNAVGFDINADYCAVSEARIPDRVLTNAARQMTVCADARQMANYLQAHTISLSLTSPPYANLFNRARKNKQRAGKRLKKHLGMLATL
jgi:DNA modification methylase